MPLLIVPSHHHSPESLESTFKNWYPLKSPSNKHFMLRESSNQIGTWIIIPTIEALNKILINSENEFSNYDYSIEKQNLSTKLHEDKDRDWSERSLDFEDPSYQYFWNWVEKAFSWAPLITNDSNYSDCMRALIEVFWTLPIVTVLQAELYDLKKFDSFWAKNKKDEQLSKEELIKNYPNGFLGYPKRIWPEFFHALSWKLLLRISHHPDRDNDPHYNPFWRDPRFGEIWEKDDVNVIVEKFRKFLMPIIQDKLEEINRAHIRV